MLLDVGHLNVASKWYKFNRENFVAELDGWVRALHLHDNDGTADYHWNVKKDSWFLDKVVKKKAGKVPMTLESNNLMLEEILEGKKIIEKYLK